MSYASNLAAASKSPLFLLEFDGDTVLSLDSASGWSGSADVTGLATTTTCKEGAAGLTWNKTGTSEVNGYIANSTLTAFDMTAAAYFKLRVFVPTFAAGFAGIHIYFGQSLSHARFCTWGSAGLTQNAWNELYWFMDGTNEGAYGYGVNGAPDMSAVTFCLVNAAFGAVGNTMSGFIVDWVTSHPWRIASGRIKSPRAPTVEGALSPPSIGTNKARIRDGALDVGSASCRVTDLGASEGWGVSWGTSWGAGGSFIGDMQTFAMPGRGAKIGMGFRGEAESAANFQAVYRGTVFDLQHQGRAWDIVLSDNLQRFRVPAMEDATAASPVTLTGNILDVWLQLLLSTGNGTNNPTYDVLSAARGAGVPVDFVDVAAIESEKTDWMLSDTCSFTFRAPIDDLLEWFYTEVCLGYGVVPVVTSDGLISAKVVRPPFGETVAVTLGETNTIAALPAYNHSKDYIYNQIRVEYGYDAVAGTYASSEVQSDAASIAKYGLRELKIRSKGITLQTVAKRVAKRILARLQAGAPPIQLQGFMSLQGVELGDAVGVSLPAVPDVENGTYGTTDKICEVLERGLNPETGKCTFTVAISSYQAGNYRRVGPASLSGDYGTWTAAQRLRYCAVNPGAASATFANGDAAHVVGPG